MRRRLRSHQLEAFKYTMQTKHPALFMDMRLGKTLVTIRRCKLYTGKPHKFLVVAPNSALGSWVDELEQEDQNYKFLEGVKVKRKDKVSDAHFFNEDSTWYLMNKEGFLSVPEIGSVSWDAVVLDESTFIKNPSSKVTRFFTEKFTHVKHRWILTGTPNPESDLDLFCQMKFLHGEFMGCDNFWKFRNKYFHPDYMGYRFVPYKGSVQRIKSELNSSAFRMTRAEAGIPDLKIYSDRMIEFPESIKKIYDKAEKEFMLELDGKEISRTIWAMTRYVWLRRLCGGWLGDHHFVWQGKVQELLSLIMGELKNDPVVIWFNFNLEIDTAAEILDSKKINYAILRGNVSMKSREAIRKRFQAGKFRVLLVQQAVAQMGINLSRADTAIYFSEPVGLLASQQTEDRILCLSKDSPLLIIRLLVKDSVDEDIRKALKMKKFRSELSLSKQIQKNLEVRHEVR